MPRPNKRRLVGSEQVLARRIALERESRGWSYAGLAARMTAQGCPIADSAIYKIEKGDPPRRITLDEFVSFANVFDIGLTELLVPVELVGERELEALWGDLREAEYEHSAASQFLEDARAALDAYLEQRPDLVPVLERIRSREVVE